jgi:deoxyribonuclease V
VRVRIAALDVGYQADAARAAGVVFSYWTDEAPDEEHVVDVAGVAPYEPGAFYRRELPCLLAVVAVLTPVDLVIVDGFVDLAPDRPGLGRHLHEALGVPVIGVAKTRFRGAVARSVLRGESARPLYVTAAGVPLEAAARSVGGMYGPHRIPTLLGRVDALSRGR